MLGLDSIKTSSETPYDFSQDGSSALVKEIFEVLSEGLVKFSWQQPSAEDKQALQAMLNPYKGEADQ